MSHLRFVYECRRLWKNAELTPDQVQEKSLRAFHRTLDYAWRKTRFYPEYWKRHGIEYGDLKFIKPEEIPFITKEDVRNCNFPYTRKWKKPGFFFTHFCCT